MEFISDSHNLNWDFTTPCSPRVQTSRSSELIFIPATEFGQRIVECIRDFDAKKALVVSTEHFSEALRSALDAAVQAQLISDSFELHCRQIPEFGFETLRPYCEAIRSGDFDLLITPTVSDKKELNAVRSAIHESGFEGKVLVTLPNSEETSSHSPTGIHRWPRQPCEGAGPFGLYMYHSSGSARVDKPLKYYFEEVLGWQYEDFQPFCNCSRVTLHSRAAGLAPNPEDVMKGYIWELKSTDYRKIVHIHMPVRLGPMIETDVPFVVNIRDPRDTYASLYFRAHGEERRPAAERTRLLMELFMGITDFQGAFAVRYLQMQDVVQNYIDALESPNCEFIRFESLGQDSIKEFKRVLNWMGVYPHPFIKADDAVFDEMVYRSSFEYQSGGERTRGDIADFHKDNRKTSLRKGLSGDWVRCFTPEVVEYFKEQTGNALQRLGYVDSDNWALPDEYAHD